MNHGAKQRGSSPRNWESLANFKADPIKPFVQYFGKFAVTGQRVFCEGYTIFSLIPNSLCIIGRRNPRSGSGLWHSCLELLPF